MDPNLGLDSLKTPTTEDLLSTTVKEKQDEYLEAVHFSRIKLAEFQRTAEVRTFTMMMMMMMMIWNYVIVSIAHEPDWAGYPCE